MEELSKQVELQKEELKKKDEQLSQYQTQQDDAKQTTTEPTEVSYTNINVDNVEDEPKEDQQYVNVDTSSGDVVEKKENGDGQEDHSAPYVNVPVDGEDIKEVNSEEKHGEEADEIPPVEFDHVVKTKLLASPSQISRAKVSTTLKRKPPSRGLIRRTAEESGSQENLFQVTEDDDYVNLPTNKAVVQQPSQKTGESNKSQQSDLDTSKDDKNEEKVNITCFMTPSTI